MDACQSIYNGGNDAGSKINNIIKQAIKGILENEYPRRGMCDILKHELELPCFLAMHLFQFTHLSSGLFFKHYVGSQPEEASQEGRGRHGFETFEEKEIHQRCGKRMDDYRSSPTWRIQFC